jgi:ATP adenylyltransferase
MSERLWAPWRMEYVQGPKAGACIFCDFASAAPARYREKLVLVVQTHALVCMNLYPFAAGHLLVAPRRHVADLAGLPADEFDATMRLMRETVARLQRATNAEGINVGINLGKAAGAGITDHLHIHAVPRWVGDSNFMPVLADLRIMPEYLDQTWQRLAEVFADVPGEHPVVVG